MDKLTEKPDNYTGVLYSMTDQACLLLSFGYELNELLLIQYPFEVEKDIEKQVITVRNRSRIVVGRLWEQHGEQGYDAALVEELKNRGLS